MSEPRPVYVLGRLPPPPDGQTLATERCASALEPAFEVHRLRTTPDRDPLRVHPRLDLRRTLHFLRLRGQLKRALAQHPQAPVFWHAISPAPLGHLRDVLATVPAFQPGQPVWAVLHRATFDRLLASSLTARRLVERVSGFVFQSEALADACARWIPIEKRRVIPNTIGDAVECTAAEVAEKPPPRDGEPLRLLFLSNMLEEKGYRDVLEAVGLLRQRGLAVQATFAGRWDSDATRAAFEQRAEALGVRQQLEILGMVTDPAIVRKLHLQAHVFVLPTYHPTETQPIAILEALNAGTPVVTVDRRATRDILTDRIEGRLAPPREPAAIAGAVQSILRPDVWTPMSHAARTRFERQFSPEAVGARWRDLAEEAYPPSLPLP